MKETSQIEKVLRNTSQRVGFLPGALLFEGLPDGMLDAVGGARKPRRPHRKLISTICFKLKPKRAQIHYRFITNRMLHLGF